MLGDVVKRGKAGPVAPMFIAGKDGAPEDPIISLFFTSGSTGLPKGAMYTELMWKRNWCARRAAPRASPARAGAYSGRAVHRESASCRQLPASSDGAVF